LVGYGVPACSGTEMEIDIDRPMAVAIESR
jgi:hypothetical protein